MERESRFLDVMYGSRVDWARAAQMLEQDARLAEHFSLLLQAERGDYRDWYLHKLRLAEHDHVRHFGHLVRPPWEESGVPQNQNQNQKGARRLPWLSRAIAAMVASTVHAGGWPTARDDKEALHCLVGEMIQQINVHDNVHARVALSWFYARGLGVDKSEARALELCKQAAESGHARALYQLGHWYGSGVHKDAVRELECITSAALQGFAPAQARMSSLCGAQLDHAREWWNYARTQRYAPALMHEVFDSEDVESMEAAAAVGHPLASVRLAHRCRTRDLRRAFDLYSTVVRGTRCADPDYMPAIAEAHRSLGLFLIQGSVALGLDADPARARHYLEFAAEHTGRADIQYLVARLYAQQGITRHRACQWLEKAAAQGHLEAQFLLGDFHRTGLAFNIRNPRAAVTWLEKAAARHHARAQAVLGLMSENGEGTPTNVPRAVELYRQSAAAGERMGQYYLGWCYEIGLHMPRDDKKATELLAKAAAQGHEGAKARLSQLLALGRDGGELAALHGEVSRLLPAAESNQANGLEQMAACHVRLTAYWQNRKRLAQLCT